MKKYIYITLTGTWEGEDKVWEEFVKIVSNYDKVNNSNINNKLNNLHSS